MRSQTPAPPMPGREAHQELCWRRCLPCQRLRLWTGCCSQPGFAASSITPASPAAAVCCPGLGKPVPRSGSPPARGHGDGPGKAPHDPQPKEEVWAIGIIDAGCVRGQSREKAGEWPGPGHPRFHSRLLQGLAAG